LDEVEEAAVLYHQAVAESLWAAAAQSLALGAKYLILAA
jgi:hypothetical protein